MKLDTRNDIGTPYMVEANVAVMNELDYLEEFEILQSHIEIAGIKPVFLKEKDTIHVVKVAMNMEDMVRQLEYEYGEDVYMYDDETCKVRYFNHNTNYLATDNTLRVIVDREYKTIEVIDV